MIFSWMNDPLFGRYRPNLITLCPSIEAIGQRIAAMAAISPPLEFEGVVLHRKTGVPIGLVEITAIDRLNSKAEFSCGFMRGHGTRCVLELFTIVLDHFFSEMLFHKLVFHVAADNDRTLRLLRRCHLLQEGLFRDELRIADDTWQDLYRFAIFAREWFASPLRLRLSHILDN